MAAPGAAAGYQPMSCGRCGARMSAPPGVDRVSCPGCQLVLQVPGRAPAPVPPAAGGAGPGAGAGGGAYAGYGAPAPPPRRPPTPAEMFAAVDSNRSGTINATELSRALSDGYHKFSLATTAMIIRMFDTSHHSVLTFAQFEALCGYLNAWRDMFRKADSDGSGAISYAELQGTLKGMGYVLSPTTLARMWLVYDEDKSGSLQFDEYIMLMAELKLTTSAFARLDTERRGVVTLNFNQYLRLMMSTKVL